MAFGELAAGLLLRALEGPFHERAERLGRRCVWWSSTVVLWGVSAVFAVALFTGQSTPAQAAGLDLATLYASV